MLQIFDDITSTFNKIYECNQQIQEGRENCVSEPRVNIMHRCLCLMSSVLWEGDPFQMSATMICWQICNKMTKNIL